MADLKVILDGDNCWPDLVEKMKNGMVEAHREGLQVARLAHGMRSGKASVMIRAGLNDGRTVLLEISQALFCAAADAFRACDEFESNETH